MDPARPSYGRVAWCYEAIAAGYSGGAIAATKASQLTELRAGDRVLYAGVGAGEDALLAAQAKVYVTGLDVSERMLQRFDRRLRRRGLEAELLCEDLFEHDRPAAYDAVAANFVLNVFPEPLMRDAVLRLARQLKPGGKLLVADFAPPHGSALRRVFARAYYRPVNLAAWAIRLCGLHPIYDYTRVCEATELCLLRQSAFPIFGAGPALFESLVLQKPD